MEQLLETVDLDVEESNELAFKIKVEGATSPAKVRLVCEAGDVAYMFTGRGTSEDGVVQFVIPQMKDKMVEGVYPARVEVLIENRYFSPVQFQINFKKAVKVVAESVRVVPRAAKPEITVTAQPTFTVKQPQAKPVVQPLVVDEQSKQSPPAKPQVTVEKPRPVSSSSPSLRERYVRRVSTQETSDAEIDDELIAELARAYAMQKRKR